MSRECLPRRGNVGLGGWPHPARTPLTRRWDGRVGRAGAEVGEERVALEELLQQGRPPAGGARGRTIESATAQPSFRFIRSHASISFESRRMPLVPIESLADDARTWVFGATPALDPSAAGRLLEDVDAYLSQWKAHGEPLTVARALMASRFLVVAVDQHTAGASGCSIDGLFRALQGAEHGYGVSLVAGGRVFWRASDGGIEGGPRVAFEKPARASWHAKLLPAGVSHG